HGDVASAAILVVDDDAPIRRMLDRTLTADGYEVRSAPDGGAALVEVEQSVPDLILLDVAMPGLDGLAVCRRLRERGLSTPAPTTMSSSRSRRRSCSRACAPSSAAAGSRRRRLRSPT